MVTAPFYVVDAFASAPFTGNPAGVCLLTEFPPAEWMQKTANEMNFAETAFVVSDGAKFRLRWFTPTVEVDLCGHATLASAHILYETDTWKRGEAITFETKSGRLVAWDEEDGITLDFPAEIAEPCDKPPGIENALGAPILDCRANRMDMLVRVESEEVLRSIQPKMDDLWLFAERGLIVTAPSSQPEYDFVSRFFAPQAGVPEDPVTGSAHCALGPYWADRLQKKRLRAFQASQRGGEVGIEIVGDRVHLLGKSQLIIRGIISA